MVDKSSSVESFLDAVEQNMQDKSRPMREQNLKLSLLQMLINSQEWEKNKIARSSIVGMKSSVEKQRKVHQIVDYIEQNYPEIQSVEEIANHFYFSSSYVCRIFKEVTSFTVSEYINLYRIAASREFLLNSDMSIATIAKKIGYQSTTYFERIFKKQISVSPLTYRKLNRK